MTRIVWTLRAVENLEAIRTYIARSSERYAALHVERLFAAVDRLQQFPESGRVVPELQRPDMREVLVGSYRIVYLVGPGVVHVLTVFHGARLFTLATDAL
jgi:plasmid stabilization system protein ParE